MTHLLMPLRLSTRQRLWPWLVMTLILLAWALHDWQQWQAKRAQQQQLTQQLRHLRLASQQHQDAARRFTEAHALIQRWQQQGLLHAPRTEQWKATLLASQERMPAPGSLRHELHPGQAWQTANKLAATTATAAATTAAATGMQQHALHLHWQGVSELEVLAMLQDFASQLSAPLDIRSCHFVRTSLPSLTHDNRVPGLDVTCQLIIYSGQQDSAPEQAT